MLISLDNITLQINGQRLLASTSWNIRTGENWAVLGPTGAGKTLLVRALCRQENLVEGQVQYFFEAADPGQQHSKNILTFSSSTHQKFLNQYAHYHQARWQSLEGEDTPRVAELLTARSIARISPYAIKPPLPDAQHFAQKQAQTIALLDLNPLLNKKTHQLSHGESRKVFLARLLLQSPRLLILDDPLVGLDLQTRQTLSAAIENLIEQQVLQVIFITTRAEEIPDPIQHMLVMHAGQVVAQGERRSLLDQPRLHQLLIPGTPSTPDYPNHPAFQTVVKGYAQQVPADVSPLLIEMENVSVRYGSTQILDQITWHMRQGERWALLGHNGAGKSTLLSLILADNPQSYAQSIRLFGQERGSGESIWEIKHRIGWVAPELHIYFRQNLTSLDAICTGFFDAIGLHHSCTPAQIAAARNWLDILGLAALAPAPFQALSTGQQRLILLARALVKNPPLLILDEPCQGLDETCRRRFIDLLDQLCAQTHFSLIYVTHYQDELPAAIDHRLVLAHGQRVF